MSESNPQTLLTSEALEAALKKDLGPEWSLMKFQVNDFTQKGDNYSCFVTGICCEAKANELTKKAYHVA